MGEEFWQLLSPSTLNCSPCVHAARAFGRPVEPRTVRTGDVRVLHLAPFDLNASWPNGLAHGGVCHRRVAKGWRAGAESVDRRSGIGFFPQTHSSLLIPRARFGRFPCIPPGRVSVERAS